MSKRLNQTCWRMLSFDDDFQVDKLMAETRCKLYKQPLNKVMEHLRDNIIRWNDKCDDHNQIESETIELMSLRLKEITNEVIDSMLYQAENNDYFHFYIDFHSSEDEEALCEDFQKLLNLENDQN